MNQKPNRATGYPPENLELVRQVCLYVATKLGDLMEELLIVGGIVPSLLVDQRDEESEIDRHIGTLDLDVGLQLALLEESRYEEVTARLRAAGFEMDTNAAGNPTRQRWVHPESGAIKLDFLIPPTSNDDAPGTLKHIERDFAALITPGLDCAFQDRVRITIDSRTIKGERAKRDLWVAGPGGFIVLKALAFRNRGENKDAYDLYYIVRNYGEGVEQVARRLAPLMHEPEAKRAVQILAEDFTDPDSLGPMRVAEFLDDRSDGQLQADVVGFVGRLLELL